MNEYYGTPSIDPNKIIYVASSFNKVYAYNYVGGQQWGGPTSVSDTYLSAIAIDTDYLYFTSQNALNVMNRATGVVVWKFIPNIALNATALPNNSIPLIDASHNIYFGDRDNSLYSINASTRTVNWSYNTGNSIASMPILNNYGNLIFGSNDGYVYDLSGNGTPTPTTVPIVPMYMLNTRHTGLSTFTGPVSTP